MAKITLTLPKGILDFWAWYAQVQKRNAAEELKHQILENTFSMLEQLQASEIADVLGLTKEYEEWKDP